jgi:hypothetical protein
MPQAISRHGAKKPNPPPAKKSFRYSTSDKDLQILDRKIREVITARTPTDTLMSFANPNEMALGLHLSGWSLIEHVHHLVTIARSGASEKERMTAMAMIHALTQEYLGTNYNSGGGGNGEVTSLLTDHNQDLITEAGSRATDVLDNLSEEAPNDTTIPVYVPVHEDESDTRTQGEYDEITTETSDDPNPDGGVPHAPGGRTVPGGSHEPEPELSAGTGGPRREKPSRSDGPVGGRPRRPAGQRGRSRNITRVGGSVSGPTPEVGSPVEGGTTPPSETGEGETEIGESNQDHEDGAAGTLSDFEPVDPSSPQQSHKPPSRGQISGICGRPLRQRRPPA